MRLLSRLSLAMCKLSLGLYTKRVSRLQYAFWWITADAAHTTEHHLLCSHFPVPSFITFTLVKDCGTTIFLFWSTNCFCTLSWRYCERCCGERAALWMVCFSASFVFGSSICSLKAPSWKKTGAALSGVPTGTGWPAPKSRGRLCFSRFILERRRIAAAQDFL